ncbi:phage tail tape measure protein [Lysinibacillus varians]|uniref:Phage tail tape measure protein n=1 Tax=Lysinibacillus varians TaxID=1145276 RepID=A0ABY2TEG8_9BACI|nr:phage tail tape measure protein [Lysinibacillus varians]AHN24360.1 hypothetical protein T479_16200 [Lysinibacillus varians]TKI66118.1 phage tail tape measure protein [Lysinibacillus varians]
MAEIGSLEVSLSLNAANFNGSIAQVNRRMTAMGSELRALSERGDAYGRSVEGLGQKQNILTRQFDAASIKLQEQRRRYDELVASGTASEAAIERQANAVNQAQAEYNRLERQLGEVTEELRVQSSQWTQAGRQLQEVGNKMQAIGGNLSSLGKDLSMKVTAPIAALGAGAFKAAVDFESAFAGVRKTVNTSEEGFKKLEQGIRDMAKELPASASDIAAVAESAGQLGIAEDKILSFSRTIIDLGESTNLTREQAATEFARFANIVGMSQDNFDRLGSSIVGLGNTMATTEAEIMSMGMRLAAQGKQVGMSEAQIMALAGTMSSLGIQAEMGGTAMTTVLKKMQTAVMDGGAALGTWAEVAQMSSSEFKKLYDESAINGLDAVIKGLATISSRGENLAVVLEDMGIKGIYESDVMMRMAGASDLLSSAVATSTDAWKENTALSNEASQRYATTASQMAMLKNKIVDIGITLGNILIPMVMSVLDVIQPWIEKFATLSEGTQKLIVIIAGIAAAIGPIIVVIGTLISSIGTIVSTVGTFALAIGEAGGIVALLTAKLSFLAPVFTALTGPIGLTVAAIGAIGTGLVIAYKKVDWFREGVLDTWEKIKNLTSNAFSSVSNLIKNYIDDAVKFATEIMDQFKAFWEENGKTITAIVQLYFGQIKANIEAVMMIIKGIYEAVWPVVTGIFKIAWETMKLTVGNALDVILGVIQTVMKLIQGDWKGAWETIQQTAINIMDNVKEYFQNVDLVQIGKDIIQGFIDGIGSMIDGVKTSASYMMSQIQEQFTEKFEELKTTITDWFTSIPSVIESKLIEWGTAISNWFTSLPENTATKLDEWWTSISDWFTSVPEKIFAKLGEWGVAILKWTDEQNEENKRQFDEWWTTISDWFTDIPGKITTKLEEWGAAIKKWFEEIPGTIAEKLSEWWTTITDWFTNTYQEITKKLEEWGTAFKKWFEDMPTNISKWLSDWWTKISTWFSEIPEMITTKLEEWWTAIKEWFEGVPDKPEIKNMGKNMIDKVSDGITEKKPELLDRLGEIIVDVALGALAVAGVALLATGREIIKRLIDGIQEAKTLLETKVKEIKSLIENKIKEVNLLQIGRDIVNGLIKGIGEKFEGVRQKVEELASKLPKWARDKLGIKSPSRVMMEVGRWTGEGLAVGIESTQARNESAMKELGQLLIDTTKSNQAEVTKIADEAEKERTKIQQDAAKKKLEIENKLGVDLKKANNTISAKKKGATANDNIKIQQLKENANAKLLKLEQDTQEKLKKVNNKAWSDMVKKEEQASGERLKVLKQYIADKDSSNELSLATEQHILEQSLKLFKDGTAEKIEVQKMYKKVTESINKEKESIDKTYVDNVKKLNDDYIKEEERLTKVYEDEFEKRRNAYYSFAGLFDEVQKRDVTGATLIAALQSQVTAFEDWQKNIASLASKGINEGLLAELQAMGPKAGAEIAALNTLTEEQLAEYTGLWKAKNELARTQTESELTELKQNTEKQINELKIKTSEQLRIYQNEWRNSMIALKGNVKTEMGEMPDIGVYAVSGLINGMLSKQTDLINAAQSLAAIVSSAFATALDIHSPSRVMRGYGVNIGEGLVLGINDMVGKVAGATKRLAKAVTDGSYKSGPGATTSSSTTHNTENNYNLTVNSTKPLDPYETARLSKNGWKEIALQI